jgi:RHS repeat-associated protein
MTMAGSVPGATGKTGSNVIYYLGSAMNDNEWHYVEADLNAIVDAEYPGHTVARVDGLMVLGGDVYLDDLVFGGGRLRRSRQVVPGAALGGVLGSWTGPNVVAENGVAARYFHYNDLGTVLAQTKADGSLEGAWEPDHFGNYEGRYAYSGSPARPELGLTGKIYDEAAGAYYVHARWLDSERGRWVSKEPYEFDGPNLYHFVLNDPLIAYDHTGLLGIKSAVKIGRAGCLGPVFGALALIAYIGSEAVDAYCSYWTKMLLDINASANDPGKAGSLWGFDKMISLQIKPGAPPLCNVILLRAKRAVDKKDYRLANAYLEYWNEHCANGTGFGVRLCYVDDDKVGHQHQGWSLTDPFYFGYNDNDR